MMRQKIRHIFLILIVFLMIMGNGSSAFAADGSSTLTIHDFSGTFDASPGSSYTSTDLFSSFKGMVPGDVRTEDITVKNLSIGHPNIHVFLKSRLHDDVGNPLSPGVAATETIASADDFLSKLNLRLWVDGTLIFDDAANIPMGSTIPLGTAKIGKDLKVTAEIAIPVTLGNEYADRAGEIDWGFLIEDHSGGSHGGGTPSGGGPGKYDSDDKLTVRKLWQDGNAAHAEDSVTVYLNRDGNPWESAVLNESNQWTHVFSHLDKGYEWTIEEISKWGDYLPEYSIDGDIVTIHNSMIEEAFSVDTDEPVDIRVVKKWAEPEKAHPDHVTCTLYADDIPMETVRLSEENDWTHTFHHLFGAVNWQVLETECEGNYIPSYSVPENGILVITNTEKLIQTGQLSWPVPVLIVLGMILIILGVIMRKKNEKRK